MADLGPAELVIPRKSGFTSHAIEGVDSLSLDSSTLSVFSSAIAAAADATSRSPTGRRCRSSRGIDRVFLGEHLSAQCSRSGRQLVVQDAARRRRRSVAKKKGSLPDPGPVTSGAGDEIARVRTEAKARLPTFCVKNTTDSPQFPHRIL